MSLLVPSWEHLYSEHHQKLYARACVYTRGNGDDANELVQDTFVRALNSPLSPGQLQTPLAYLTLVMRRVFVDQYRRAKHMKTDSYDNPLNVQLQKELIVEPEVQRDLENKELLKAVLLKGARLSATEKKLYELMTEGKDFDEIALICHQDARITRIEWNALRAKLR